MLDINYLRENLADVKKALAKKHPSRGGGAEADTIFDLDKILKLDDERKDLLKRVEELRGRQNNLAKEGKKSDEAVEIKRILKDLEPQLQEAEEAFYAEAVKLHNIPDKSVPSKEEGNKVEKEVGEIPKFDFDIKSHAELGKNLDIIDTQRAVKVSGNRFCYLKKEAVILEFALIQYLIEKLTKKGFSGLLPPALVKEEAMWGTGFFPAEKNEIYRVNPEEDNLYLAGTAEVPMASYHSHEIFSEDDLPKKYWGFSTCYRREAGAYGKDTQGIIRLHQFDKIEMFVFTKPEDSWKVFDELVKINEEIFSELGLPYRLVNISGGELGAPNAKKIDTEVWIPSENQYRELTSCSHDTDFQARRLNIKYQTEEGKKEFVHTLNDTALAMGRTIVAIMENFQTKDGSIKIPEVLHKYTGFDIIKR